MDWWTRRKLKSIRWLLWRADAIICSLPTPARPEGAYFEVWGALGNIHGAIGKLPDDLAGSGETGEAAE